MAHCWAAGEANAAEAIAEPARDSIDELVKRTVGAVLGHLGSLHGSTTTAAGEEDLVGLGAPGAHTPPHAECGTGVDTRGTNVAELLIAHGTPLDRSHSASSADSLQPVGDASSDDDDEEIARRLLDQKWADVSASLEVSLCLSEGQSDASVRTGPVKAQKVRRRVISCAERCVCAVTGMRQRRRQAKVLYSWRLLAARSRAPLLHGMQSALLNTPTKVSQASPAELDVAGHRSGSTPSNDWRAVPQINGSVGGGARRLVHGAEGDWHVLPQTGTRGNSAPAEVGMMQARNLDSQSLRRFAMAPVSLNRSAQHFTKDKVDAAWQGLDAATPPASSLICAGIAEGAPSPFRHTPLMGASVCALPCAEADHEVPVR